MLANINIGQHKTRGIGGVSLILHPPDVCAGMVYFPAGGISPLVPYTPTSWLCETAESKGIGYVGSPRGLPTAYQFEPSRGVFFNEI